MKCPNCGADMFTTRGGNEICPSCGYGSSSYRKNIKHNINKSSINTVRHTVGIFSRIRHAVGIFLQFVFGISGLFFVGMFFMSSLGLTLKFFDLLFGDKNYSDWMFMSAAEEPAGELFLYLIVSIIGVPICLFMADFVKRTLVERR